MSKNITLGFKRAGGKPDLIYGTETSFAAQRAALAALKKSDTYEKVEIWERGIPVKTKRIAYTNQPTLTVTAVDKTVIYGAAIPAYTATYAGWTDGDTIKRNDLEGALAFACAYAAGGDVGTYPITPSGRTSEKYNLSFGAGTLTVTKKSLTVTTSDAEIFYGDAAPTFEDTFTGFIADEDETDLTGSKTHDIKNSSNETVSNVATAPAGDYEVSVVGLTSNNYVIVPVPGTLTVKKKSLTLTVTDAEMVEGASAPSFAFTGVGYIAGEDETALGGSAVYTFKDELGNTVADLTLAEPGTYTIHLSGITSENYELTMVAGTLTITDNGA